MYLFYQLYVFNEKLHHGTTSIINNSNSSGMVVLSTKLESFEITVLILNSLIIIFELTIISYNKQKIYLITSQNDKKNRTKILKSILFFILMLFWYFFYLITRYLLITLLFMLINYKLDNFNYIFLFFYVNVSIYFIINISEVKHQYNLKHLNNKKPIDELSNMSLTDVIHLNNIINIFEIIVLYSFFGINWFYNINYACFYELINKKTSIKHNKTQNLSILTVDTTKSNNNSGIVYIRYSFEIFYYIESALLTLAYYYYYYYLDVFNRTLASSYLLFIIIAISITILIKVIVICVNFCCFKNINTKKSDIEFNTLTVLYDTFHNTTVNTILSNNSSDYMALKINDTTEYDVHDGNFSGTGGVDKNNDSLLDCLEKKRSLLKIHTIPHTNNIKHIEYINYLNILLLANCDDNDSNSIIAYRIKKTNEKNLFEFINEFKLHSKNTTSMCIYKDQDETNICIGDSITKKIFIYKISSNSIDFKFQFNNKIDVNSIIMFDFMCIDHYGNSNSNETRKSIYIVDWRNRLLVIINSLNGKTNSRVYLSWIKNETLVTKNNELLLTSTPNRKTVEHVSSVSNRVSNMKIYNELLFMLNDTCIYICDKIYLNLINKIDLYASCMSLNGLFIDSFMNIYTTGLCASYINNTVRSTYLYIFNNKFKIVQQLQLNDIFNIESICLVRCDDDSNKEILFLSRAYDQDVIAIDLKHK